MQIKKKFAALLIIPILALSIMGNSGCTSDDTDKSAGNARDQVNKVTKSRGPAYIPKNSVEFNNYNRAQKLYDSPSTIIWCTTTFENPSSPLITVPIAGKLTSSSVSYFATQQVREYDSQNGTYNPELRSVDGMYHGSPGPYRYGFTPGGQYVEFTSIGTFCTTSLTKFQREKTTVSVETDGAGDAAQNKAEAILKQGTDSKGVISPAAKKQAQAVLTDSGLESK